MGGLFSKYTYVDGIAIYGSNKYKERKTEKTSFSSANDTINNSDDNNGDLLRYYREEWKLREQYNRTVKRKKIFWDIYGCMMLVG